MQTISLSQEISSSRISIVEDKNGILKTRSSGRFNYLVFPSLILIGVVALLIFTNAYAVFGVKNYIGLLFITGLMGGFIYFFWNRSFLAWSFDLVNNELLKNGKQICNLDEIKGIQILTFHHTVTGNYKIRFEINLIKKNEERIYLFNNSSYQRTVKQAQKLSEYLNIEIFDLTEQ